MTYTGFSSYDLDQKKSMSLKGFQIIYPAGGAKMSRADPVVWHVTGKP